MAKIERRTLYAETVDLVAKMGTTVSIDLPRDKFIRRIELRQHGDIDIDTLGTTLVPAAAPSLIGKIRLIRDGSETLISADPAYLMVMDYVEHGGSPSSKIPHIDVANNQTWYSNLSLDFMVNPMNHNEVFLYDQATGKVFTVMLPAMDYSSLKLEIDIDSGLTTSAAAGLYDVAPTTISGFTAELDITLEEVFMEQGDPVITRNNVFELRTIQNEKTLAASQDALPYEVTTGVLMRRLALFQFETGGYGTPARPAQNDDGKELIERFKLKQTSPISWTMRDEHFGAMQAQDILEYNVDTMENVHVGITSTTANAIVLPDDHDVGIFKGFTVMDFDDGRNLVGSLDLTGMKSGDIKLFMKTTAQADATDKIYVIEHYMI